MYNPKSPASPNGDSLQANSGHLECMKDILGEKLVTQGAGTDPALILPHLYLGSQLNAESLPLLRRLGITHVLNCAGFRGPRKSYASPYASLDIDYYEFKAVDTDNYNITQHFKEAFKYLDKVKIHGGIALVHCALGVNRSAAITVAYLMTQKQMPLLDAVKYVKQRRHLILSNKGFQAQLVEYAKSIGLLGTLPEKYRVEIVSTTPRDYTNCSYGPITATPFDPTTEQWLEVSRQTLKQMKTNDYSYGDKPRNHCNYYGDLGEFASKTHYDQPEKLRNHSYEYAGDKSRYLSNGFGDWSSKNRRDQSYI